MKTNSSVSTLSELVRYIPEGFDLRLALFDFLLKNLFYVIEIKGACSFADDSIFCSCDSDLIFLQRFYRMTIFDFHHDI